MQRLARTLALAIGLPLDGLVAARLMFRISIVDTPSERTLVLEGTLINPWTIELQKVWQSAGQEPNERKLVIDLTNVTVISQEGENILFELMRAGAKFSCCGVLTKHVLKQLAHRYKNQSARRIELSGW